MKFSLSWLKEHLETSASLNEIADTLTKIGLEVETITDKGAMLAPFITAKVLSATQHPNADRLRVCMVDCGNGAPPLQVVCGAPNARAGMVSVFSPPGSYIPAKNITLSVGTIRGVESHGMLCSEYELELSQDHDGIIDLPADTPIGMKYTDYAKLNDPVIEINLTPNRPDCTGVAGIARDLAAAGLGKLITPQINAIKGHGNTTIKVNIATEPHFCPSFGLRLVKGVKNGVSPQWLQDKLKSIGLRPINALVDITNYMTHDRARPLHVFDADKVHGDLTIRHALAGESFVALDGKTYTFQGGEVIICDANGIESLAGIMGGQASGCDENTVNVLIESALWDPLTIARTGRIYGINSDARYRFERGIDPQFTLEGLELATKFTLDLCGGEATHIHLEGNLPNPQNVIAFPPTEVKRLTGLELAEEEMRDILTNLGFKCHANSQGDWKVETPTWRSDIEGKADLVEEITRIKGLEHVVSTPLSKPTSVPKAILTTLQKRTRQAKRFLANQGLVEAVTWSFVSKSEAQAFGGGSNELELANPIASDLSDMRPSLLIGLLKAAQRNSDRGFPNLALFEVGQIFKNDTPEGQKITAAGLRMGASKSWQGETAATVYDVKADCLALLESLGANVTSLQLSDKTPSYMHPGRSGVLQLGPQNQLAVFGQLHPILQAQFGLDQEVFVFEITLNAIAEPKAKATRIKPMLTLSTLQPLTRDFAFIVDENTKAGDLVKLAGGVDKKLISNVALFDIYQGKGIAEGKKSLGITLTLQPFDKTLTDIEIEAVSNKLITDVASKLKGTLRG